MLRPWQESGEMAPHEVRITRDYGGTTMGLFTFLNMRKAAEEAKGWWSQNSKETVAKCDRCSGTIQKGKGYLVGPRNAYVQSRRSSGAQKEMRDMMMTICHACTPEIVCKDCLQKSSGQPWAIPWSEWVKIFNQKGDLP